VRRAALTAQCERRAPAGRARKPSFECTAVRLANFSPWTWQVAWPHEFLCPRVRARALNEPARPNRERRGLFNELRIVIAERTGARASQSRNGPRRSMQSHVPLRTLVPVPLRGHNSALVRGERSRQASSLRRSRSRPEEAPSHEKRHSPTGNGQRRCAVVAGDSGKRSVALTCEPTVARDGRCRVEGSQRCPFVVDFAICPYELMPRASAARRI